MTDYRRAHIPGGMFFFTVNLAVRRSQLLTNNIERLRSAFQYTRSRHPFTVEAIVVLPDHLHPLWTLPESDPNFALRWRLIKANFSRALPSGERLSESRAAKAERGIWQRRYWEHATRDEDDFNRHLDYIHFNPVKHGYVNHPGEWPFSSFRRMVRRGTYAAVWVPAHDDDQQASFGERP